MAEGQKETLDAYYHHYKNLLRIKEAKNPKETEVEKRVSEKFHNIICRGNSAGRKVITDSIVSEAINKMKTRRAADWHGWTGEWVKIGA